MQLPPQGTLLLCVCMSLLLSLVTLLKVVVLLAMKGCTSGKVGCGDIVSNTIDIFWLKTVGVANQLKMNYHNHSKTVIRLKEKICAVALSLSQT